MTKTPDYLNQAGTVPSTEEFYWANRLIGALADAHYARTASAIERYQKAVASAAHAMICDTDKKEAEGGVTAFLEQANAAMAAMVKEKTDTCLGKVLYEASMAMKNGFSRSDA